MRCDSVHLSNQRNEHGGAALSQIVELAMDPVAAARAQTIWREKSDVQAMKVKLMCVVVPTVRWST